MQTIARSLTAVPLALLLFAAAATAQEAAPSKLQLGVWTGNVTPPGQGNMPVTLTVTEDDKGPAMNISLGEHGSFPASSIKFTADTFEFSFMPGPMVTCILLKADDGSYAGNCTDDGGDAARLVVTPPKKES